MAIVGDVFGLNSVYDRQVENVENNNLESWPEGATYGYFAGGFSPPRLSVVERLDFSSETLSTPGNNLSQAKSSLGSVSSSAYGYFGGGATAPTTLIATVDRFDYSNETTSTPGNNLPQARISIAAVSSSAYGYFTGGENPPISAIYSLVERLDFSSETLSTPGNNLPKEVAGHTATSSTSYGYFAGGYSPSVSNQTSTVDRIDFSSETLSTPGNVISQARGGGGSVSSSAYGFFGGGFAPPNNRFAIVDRIDFSNETTSAPGNNLTQARTALSGTSSSSYGYFGGGNIPTPPFRTDTIDRIDFSNETTSAPGNNLPSERESLGTLSGGASVARGKGYKTYGYYGGGYRGSPSLYESRIERIDFSTQTDSIMTSRLIYQHSSCNTVSSNKHGYFVGGFVPNPTFPNQSSKVQRFDFISEVVTELPSQASYEIAGSGTLSNAQYGYIGGGTRGPGGFWTSNVTRLDFSSNLFSQPSSILTEARSVLNGVSDLRNNLGYFGGGYSSCRVCRIDLSSETITQNPSPLDKDMSQSRSYQTGDYGYWAGGKYSPNQPSPGARASGSTRKVQFSTGTTQVGSPMYTGRYAGGVSQDNYYAWYAAGTAPSFVRTSNVQRVELSTETYSDPGNPLAIIRSSTIGGLSN